MTRLILVEHEKTRFYEYAFPLHMQISLRIIYPISRWQKLMLRLILERESS